MRKGFCKKVRESACVLSLHTMFLLIATIQQYTCNANAFFHPEYTHIQCMEKQ